VREELDNAWNHSVARSVVHLHHLDELADIARTQHLEMALLKGAAFSTTLYRHPALRPMSDLDVLVRPRELDRWADALAALGYAAKDVSDHAVALQRSESGVYVELHRTLTSCARFVAVDTDELFRRSLPAPCSATPFVRTLAPEDHLLHLCLHGSFQHGLRQPAVNAWDARRLAEREIDPDLFLERARRPELARWAYAGLRLAEIVFPSAALANLADRLAPAVPRRLVRWTSRLEPERLLAPCSRAVFGPPWQRIAWAGNPLKTLSLLIEVSRPRSGEGSSRAFPLFRRILQLVFHQGVPELRAALEKCAALVLGSTSASLGEVRDV
jgi:hypothetical protein